MEGCRIQRLNPEHRRRVKILKEIFRDGYSIIGGGDKGHGKTNFACMVMDTLRHEPGVHCLTNIKFFKDYQGIQTVTSFEDFLIKVCEIRMAWFDTMTDADKNQYYQGILPASAPLIIVVLDEAERFLHKLRSTSTGAYDFGTLFIPMIRKLGISLFLIYHEVDDSVKALREEGKGQFGIIDKPRREIAIITVRGAKTLIIDDIEKTDLWFDSWSPAAWDMAGVDIKRVLNLAGTVTSDKAPFIIHKFLMEGPDGGEEFPIKDWKDGAALVYNIAKRSGSSISFQKIADILGIPRRTIQDRHKKLTEEGVLLNPDYD